MPSETSRCDCARGWPDCAAGCGYRWRIEFVLETATVLVATAAILVLLDWWFRSGVTARIIFLELVLLGVVPFVLIRGFRRWRASRLDDLTLAMVLDRFRPGIGGRIADVLQLPDQLGEPATTVSPAMIRLAVKRANEGLAGSDWASLWNRRRTAMRSSALLFAVVVPALFAALAPNASRLSVRRWLFGSTERWPQRNYLTVTGLGDRKRLLAPRDEPFALEVRADLPALEPRDGRWIVRGRGEPLLLRSRPVAPETPDTVRLRERTAKGGVRNTVMTVTGPASFRHELPPSASSTTFELSGGDDWLGPIKVERVDRPALASTRLRVREPGSTANTWRVVQESIQQPVFLPDTEVELTLVGNEPISDARLTVHPGEPPKLDRVDARTFVARWILREATTLEVDLTSEKTSLTSKTAYLSIGILKDREPRVTLRALGVGAHVTAVATIPLSITATDDMGLATVRLQIERTATDGDKGEPKTTKKTVPLPLAADAARVVLDHQARHDVELQAEPPAVGTVLRFVAEAEDRCARGVQVGRSTSLHMQVVSPNELYYEILIRQRRASEVCRTHRSGGEADIAIGRHAGARHLCRSHAWAAHVVTPARADRRAHCRHAARDEAEPGWITQVIPPASRRSNRSDPRTELRSRKRTPRRASVAIGDGLEAGRQSRGSPPPARGGRDRDEKHSRADVSVGKFCRRRKSGGRSDQNAAQCSRGRRESPRVAHSGGFRW